MKNNPHIRTLIILLILTAAAALSFFIRMRSFDILYDSGNMIGGPDPWFYLRQVELSLANGLGNVSYDPYLLFPGGGGTRVGSLFVRICAVVALLFGCVTQTDLINVLSFVPAVMGVCMVPVMYFLGKKCGGRAAGVLAALFIAVIGGQFLARTLYGYVDHHALETLISSLFCLSYIAGLCALKGMGEKNTGEKNTGGGRTAGSWKTVVRKPVICGLIAGCTFFLGFQNLYVMALFALIALIYTIIQFVINQKTRSPSEPLLIFNTAVFLPAAAGYFVCGITGVSEYSAVYLFLQLFVVIVTLILYALSKLISRFEKPWYILPVSFAGLTALAALILRFAAEPVFTSVLSNFTFFFGFSPTMNTVGEMSTWSLPQAFSSYNLFLILAAGGCVWMAVKLWNKHSPAALFVLVWTAVFLPATCVHIRTGYYLAVCIALLAAVCVAETVRFTKDALPKRNSVPDVTGTDAAPGAFRRKRIRIIKTVLLILTVVLALGGFGLSAAAAVDMAVPSVAGGAVNPYWYETCEWIRDNTPDPGIPFIDNYSRDKIYESAHPYGVLSWWDYGYYIMEIGKRLPAANSGQARAAEAARILLSPDETDIREQLEALKVKYVITDSRMCSSSFPAITVWADPEAQIKPYRTEVKRTEGDGADEDRIEGVRAEEDRTEVNNADGSPDILSAPAPAYYETLLIRLHRFDGSLVPPDKTEGVTSGDIPALTCFRLVHESPSAQVKVFELVDGARIAGEGTIECEVTTDQGRKFTYRQTSTDGAFVVPYVTGTNGGVTASEYRITETGERVSVPEGAVRGMVY